MKDPRGSAAFYFAVLTTLLPFNNLFWTNSFYILNWRSKEYHGTESWWDNPYPCLFLLSGQIQSKHIGSLFSLKYCYQVMIILDFLIMGKRCQKWENGHVKRWYGEEVEVGPYCPISQKITDSIYLFSHNGDQTWHYIKGRHAVYLWATSAAQGLLIFKGSFPGTVFFSDLDSDRPGINPCIVSHKLLIWSKLFSRF